MIDQQTIVDLTEQFLLVSESDSFLAEVKVSKDNRIVVNIDNDKGVDIDECVALSEYVEAHLDRDQEDFELEVGSAELGAPLSVLRQYAKFEGQTMEVLCPGGKKWVGILGSADAEGFDLTVTRREKVAGSKKKTDVTETLHFRHDEVNQVKYSFG